MKRIPDADLIHQLQYGKDRELDLTFSYLYRRMYDQVFHFVKKYKGHEADVEDLFHEGLIALFKLARRGRLAADLNIEAYLFSICNLLWFKQLQKKKVFLHPDDVQIAAPIVELPIAKMIKQEERELVLRLLNQLGQDCRKVLVYYYYDRFRMKKIAELMGYASDQVAKNRKSECMKKLKNLLK